MLLALLNKMRYDLTDGKMGKSRKGINYGKAKEKID